MPANIVTIGLISDTHGLLRPQAIAALQGWAQAWSDRDVPGYLAHYASDFEVPGGASRATWEKERKDRIERPKSIEVKIEVASVKMGDNEAVVTFHQTYKSDTLKSSNTKVVKLVHVGDKWLIKQERAGG